MLPEPRPPTESEVKNAAAARDVAAADEAAAALDAILERPFDAERDVFLRASGDDDEAEFVRLEAEADEAARAACEAARKDLYARARTPEDIAWAIQRIKLAEDEAERVRREAAARTRSAKRRADRIESMLWPACEEYTRRTPPKKGTKSWRFDSTTMNLRARSGDAQLEVVDERQAVAWVRAAVQYAEREPEDGTPMVRVTESVNPGALRDWLAPRIAAALAMDAAADDAARRLAALVDSGEDMEVRERARAEAQRARAAADTCPYNPKRLQWLRFTPPGDRISIYRR